MEATAVLVSSSTLKALAALQAVGIPFRSELLPLGNALHETLTTLGPAN